MLYSKVINGKIVTTDIKKPKRIGSSFFSDSKTDYTEFDLYPQIIIGNIDPLLSKSFSFNSENQTVEVEYLLDDEGLIRLKESKLSELNYYYKAVQASPTCDTGLGFRVDCGYNNKTDFEAVYQLAAEYINDPAEFRSSESNDAINIVDKLVSGNANDGYMISIRDADNQYQTVELEQMTDIIKAIRNFGFRLKPMKWAMEEQIKAATLETIHDINPTQGWP